MVVKSERGRRRYILFRMSSDISREELIRRANRLCGKDDSPYIVQSEHGMSIVRCSPETIGKTIGMMMEIDRGCVSLTTSGTLRTIRDSYPDMCVKARRN